MVTEKNLLLEEKELLGEFWFHPEGARFSGKLVYSPKQGLSLTLVSESRELARSSRVIYGKTVETGELTIFTYGNSSGQRRISSCLMTERTIPCEMAICGLHADQNQTFSSVAFRLSLLDEFCYPQADRLQDVVCKDDALISFSESMKISLQKGYSAHFGEPNWIDIFKSQEMSIEQIENVNKKIEDVFSSHGIDFPATLSDVYYFLLIEFLPGKEKGILETILEIYSLKNLFSLLILDNQFLLSLTLFESHDDSRSRPYPALFSLHLREGHESQLKTGYRRHHTMLVTKADIASNFNGIINNWRPYYSSPMNIVVSTLMHHLSHSRNHHQQFILLLASIEQCFVESAPGHQESEKYQWVIDNYGGMNICSSLLKYLYGLDGSIGKCLSEVRAGIIHPASRKRKFGEKCLRVLDESNVANINEALFVILLIFVYEKLGIGSLPIEKLKAGYLSFRPRYDTVDFD